MSTAQPDPQSSQQLVRVQVYETVEQVNARGPMSAKDFEIFASVNGRCELVEGQIRMMNPAGSEHGYVANEIAFLLNSHVRQLKLGRVYAAETGFVLQRSPDTVRAPDVAFIAAPRVPAKEPSGFGDIVPDLVVEVISPSDHAEGILEKTQMWIDAGVRCVVNVYPWTHAAETYRTRDTHQDFQGEDIIDLCDIVQDWNPQLKTFFGNEG